MYARGVVERTPLDRLRPGWAARGAAAALVAISVVATSGACLPDGRACSPGDYQPCTCEGGAAGATLCNSAGSAYGACDCTLLLDAGVDAVAMDGTSPEGDANTHDAAQVDASPCNAATARPIFCPCTDNGQCADGICHTYNGRGQLCTKMCTSNGECPTPQSKGCSMMSFVCAPS